MLPIIGYIPYAAVGYCVAALATDVWPALMSSRSAMTYPSSRHGMDGEEYAPTSRQYCGPYDAVMSRNQSFSASLRSTQYCYNAATGAIEGNGPLNGVVPAAGTVQVYTDEDGRETAKVFVSGDNSELMAVCYQPGSFSATPGGGGYTPGYDTVDPTGTPGYDPNGQGTPGFDPCFDPRPRGDCARERGARAVPVLARAMCQGDFYRNQSRNRKARRWGRR